MPPSASSASSASQSPATPRPLQAVMTLSALFFLARLTGLVQRLIILALLPTTATDAYTAAFGLPDALNYIVAGGAISISFIPIFAKFWKQGREAEAWRFFSTLATVVGCALVVLTAAMMIWTPFLLLLRFPGFVEPDKAETYALTIKLTRVILPAQLFFYLGGLLVGVLNTFKRFGATGWTSAVNNVVAMGCGVALLPSFGPIGFAWGILLGAFCGNFLLPLLAAQRGIRAQRPRFAWRFNLADPAVRRFFALVTPIIFSVSLPIVDQYVVSFFASSMAQGSLTYLDNANRLMIAAQGVLGQAAAVAAFPYLAGESAGGDYRAFSDFLRSGLRRLLFVALPVSTLLVLCAAPLTRLISGYGQFNDPLKLQSTSLYFALYSLGLFAWVGQGLVARGFYALGDTRTPTLLGGGITIFFFVPLCALMGHFYGAAGLALATSIGAATYFVTILVSLDRKLKMRPYQAPLGLAKIGSTLLRTGSACALMALAGFMALRLALLVIADNKLGDIGLILWTGGVAAFVFAASAGRFEIPEWAWVRQKMRRKSIRKPKLRPTQPGG